MKYKIRQRVKDPISGLMRDKIVTIDGALHLGLVDKNGVELFEGDKVKCQGETYIVAYKFKKVAASEMELVERGND